MKASNARQCGLPCDRLWPFQGLRSKGAVQLFRFVHLSVHSSCLLGTFGMTDTVLCTGDTTLNTVDKALLS